MRILLDTDVVLDFLLAREPFELDARAYREMAARGEITFGEWIGSLTGSRKVYNLFRWDDPMPWLGFWGHRLVRHGRRGPRLIASRLRQWRATAS